MARSLHHSSVLRALITGKKNLSDFEVEVGQFRLNHSFFQECPGVFDYTIKCVVGPAIDDARVQVPTGRACVQKDAPIVLKNQIERLHWLLTESGLRDAFFLKIKPLMEIIASECTRDWPELDKDAIVGDAYVDLLKGLTQLQPDTTKQGFCGWLRTVIRRKKGKKGKKETTKRAAEQAYAVQRRELDARAFLDDHDTVDGVLDSLLANANIRQDDRKLLKMLYVDGKSRSEVAEHLGKSKTAIYSKVCYLMKKLRKARIDTFA